MVSEERETIIKKGSESKYLSLCKKEVWPSLKSHGGKVICLMKGPIGLSPTTLGQITSYNDIHSWDGSQDSWPSLREQFVERERVRVLKPISRRPKNVIPVEDRRPVYGYRKFIISSNDL